jgi:shikimate dehydrogenase
MDISRDTVICGSLAKTKGSFGVRFFNHAFRAAGMDWIYLPFAVDEIVLGVTSMETLGLRGVGVSMPFKSECMRYMSEVTPDAAAIGAVNTVIRHNGFLVGHNTDWLAARRVLSRHGRPRVVILGNGGYARAIKYACSDLGMSVVNLVRADWHRLPDLRKELVFNATPATDLTLDPSCDLIDGRVGTPTGDELAYLQACEQFKIYTGQEVPEETRMKYGLHQ